MRYRVLLDVDGVLCDFLRPAVTVMNRLLGTAVAVEQMKSWHLFDAFDFTVSKEMQDACYDEWKKPGWCRALPVYPEAIEGVGRLQEIADVFIVTSPMNGPTWVHEREGWLQSHFGFSRKNIVHTDAKFVCAGDILVDDKTENCAAWSRCHPDGIGVRWHQFTNRGLSYIDGPTVDSWAQVEDVLSLINPIKELSRWKRQITSPLSRP